MLSRISIRLKSQLSKVNDHNLLDSREILGEKLHRKDYTGYEDTKNYQRQGRLHDKDHHNHVGGEKKRNVS